MLTAKKQKKIYRKLTEFEEKFNVLMTDKVYEYFTLFCMVMLFDVIADIFRLWAVMRYRPGIGPIQIIIATICIVQMWRYANRIKK